LYPAVPQSESAAQPIVQNVRRPSSNAHRPVPHSALVVQLLQSGGAVGGSPHSCAALQTLPGGQWLLVTHAKQLCIAVSQNGFVESPQSVSALHPGIVTHVFVVKLHVRPSEQSCVVKHSTHAFVDALQRCPGQS
jgi:hypothetical protein